MAATTNKRGSVRGAQAKPTRDASGAHDATLTPERILDAAEEALRRFGPVKATVVDVARALGVSHGSVYRHVPSKAALRDAVAARWLERVSAPLEALAKGPGPAPQRLRCWLDRLMAIMRQRRRDDPELFATYLALTEEARDVVHAHIDTLTAQLTQIVAEGVARGEFSVSDSARAARAVFDATGRFHRPAHAAEWADPATDAAFEGVWALVLRGLGAAPPCGL
jgi:AcrR family transcriptional regulator